MSVPSSSLAIKETKVSKEETKVSKESQTLQHQVILDNNIFHRSNVKLPEGQIVPVELLEAIHTCEQLKRLILPALIIESCGTSFGGKDPEKIHIQKEMDLCKYSLKGGSNIIFDTNITQLSKVLAAKSITATNIRLDHLAMLVKNVTLDDVNRGRAVDSKINKQKLQVHKDLLLNKNFKMGLLNSGDLLYLLAASIYNVPLITANNDMIEQLTHKKKENSIIAYIFAHVNIIVPKGTTEKEFNSGKQKYLDEALNGADGILSKVRGHYQFKTLSGEILKSRCHSLRLMELCGLLKQPDMCFLDVPCIRVAKSAGKSTSSDAGPLVTEKKETKEKKEVAELKKTLDVPAISPSEKDGDDDDDYLAETADMAPIKGSKNFGLFMCIDLPSVSGPSCKKPVDCVPMAPLLRRSISATA